MLSDEIELIENTPYYEIPVLAAEIVKRVLVLVAMTQNLPKIFSWFNNGTERLYQKNDFDFSAQSATYLTPKINGILSFKSYHVPEYLNLRLTPRTLVVLSGHSGYSSYMIHVNPLNPCTSTEDDLIMNLMIQGTTKMEFITLMLESQLQHIMQLVPLMGNFICASDFVVNEKHYNALLEIFHVNCSPDAREKFIHLVLQYESFYPEIKNDIQRIIDGA